MVDNYMVEELLLCIYNESRVYEQYKAIVANLKKKSAKGVYDKEKAAKAWLHWVNAFSKIYAKDFGYPGMTAIKACDRIECARLIERNERDAILGVES